MKELLTVVTRKGQITVPAEIRKALALMQGDKVALSVPDPVTGQVRLRRVGSVVEQSFGALSSAVPSLDARRERAAFEEGVADEVQAEAPGRRDV